MAMSGLSTRRLNLLQQFASLILQQFHNNEAAQSGRIRTSSKRNQSPVLSLADMNDLSSNRDASQCPRKNMSATNSDEMALETIKRNTYPKATIVYTVV
jgi:hypothetical protein